VSATTLVDTIPIRFVGVCIPYHAYHTQAKWGDKRLKVWQGAGIYLDELRHNILVQAKYQERTVVLGDFNLQIPAHNYPYPNTDVNHKREETFEDWHIPTAGDIDDVALDKRFIDHVALSADMTIGKMSFISRFGASKTPLSDHNGVYLEINL
jgi:endonuclease/exonuclease/phosphatase family metal-dependent hydrolase